MKKLLLALAAATGLALAADFEEAGGSVRRGSLRDTPLYDGSSATGRSSTHKVGSYSLQIASIGDVLLALPRGGLMIPSTNFTIAQWVYLLSTPSSNGYLACNYRPHGYPGYFCSAINGSDKPYVTTTIDESGSQSIYTYGSGLSHNAWHLIVLTSSAYGPYGNAQQCISVDNSAFTCGSLSFNILGGGVNDFTFGSGLDAYVDGVLIANRVWTPTDVSAYYNSGSGVNFPFYFPFY